MSDVCTSVVIDDNPSVVCNEDGGAVDGRERVCLLPKDHWEPHDFAVIAGRTSFPDRLKELAALKDGWLDGQGLAITPGLRQRDGSAVQAVFEESSSLTWRHVRSQYE